MSIVLWFSYIYPHAENQASPVYTIDGFTFDPPTVPVLLQILNGANVSELVPAGSIYGLDANKSVEISIPAGGGNVSVR